MVDSVAYRVKMVKSVLLFTGRIVILYGVTGRTVSLCINVIHEQIV